MKKSTIQTLTRNQRRIAAAFMLTSFLPTASLALPTLPQIANGTANITTTNNTMTITNSANAIINWQGFSIGSNETTRFIQPSAASAVLNRITGGDPSRILGALQSNGKVLLINPNGILFGQNSRVDVNGLIASTLNITNQDFLAGRMKFNAGPIAGKVENQGKITTPNGGQVYLIAPDVTNSGVITAPNGVILLAAGKEVLLVDKTNPEIAMVVSAPEHQSINLGTLVADAGRVGMYGGIVRQKGIISADSAVMEGGRIFLKATREANVEAGSTTSANGSKGGSVTVQTETGETLASGAISATGSAGEGGTVRLLGTGVGLFDTATVDASGITGGGTVLVGGDFQGKNPLVLNAEATFMGKDTTIKADAVNGGDGGKVIVWADNTTRAYGSISARGGVNGGNGGFVETSGKNYLDFQGIADLRAPHGSVGTLLLDPSNITILATNYTPNYSSGTFVSGVFSNVVGTAGLSWGVINTQLGLGSLVIQTSPGLSGNGDILINGGTSTALTSANSLTLLANRDIAFVPSVNVTNSGNGDINLIAGWNNTGWAVNSGTGNITFGAGSSLSVAGNFYGSAGNAITLDTGSTVVAGTVNLTAGTISQNSGAIVRASNKLLIKADNISFQGTMIGKCLTGGGCVDITGYTSGRAIEIGGATATVGTLSITQADLAAINPASSNIRSGQILIGDTNAGSATFKGNFTSPGGMFALVYGATISQLPKHND